MLAYSLETMGRSGSVHDLVLVVRHGDRRQAETLFDEGARAKLRHVVVGGATRHESERAGLEALAPDIVEGSIDVVAIHDGARPFMTLDLLEAVITTARQTGGAVPGLRSDEVLYRVDDHGAHALPQETLRRVQTPQAFWARPLLDAYRRAGEAGFEGVDTAETVERFSELEIAIVPGDPRNIKVTFVEDLFRAEDYALDWDGGRWAPGRA